MVDFGCCDCVSVRLGVVYDCYCFVLAWVGLYLRFTLFVVCALRLLGIS